MGRGRRQRDLPRLAPCRRGQLAAVADRERPLHHRGDEHRVAHALAGRTGSAVQILPKPESPGAQLGQFLAQLAAHALLRQLRHALPLAARKHPEPIAPAADKKNLLPSALRDDELRSLHHCSAFRQNLRLTRQCRKLGRPLGVVAARPLCPISGVRAITLDAVTSDTADRPRPPTLVLNQVKGVGCSTIVAGWKCNQSHRLWKTRPSDHPALRRGSHRAEEAREDRGVSAARLKRAATRPARRARPRDCRGSTSPAPHRE